MRRTSIVRTRVAAATVAGLLVLSACSLGGPTDDEDGLSGTLNILAYSGIWEQRFNESVIQAFQEAHPNVTINYSSKRNSAEMLSDLVAQGDNTRTDVAIMDDSVTQSGNAQGVLAQFDETDVPNLAQVQDQFLDPDGYGPVLQLDAIGLIYDTEVFTEPPTSWEELWNPEWSGMVNLHAPPSMLGLAATAAASTLVGEDYTEGIDEGIEKLQELAPSVQTFSPSPDEWQHIITGQSVIGVGQNARAQYYADQSDGQLGFAFPDEGSFYQLNTISMVDGAPNEEAAAAFIDYALSDEAQLAFAEALFYAPSTDVDVPDELAARLVATDGSVEILPLETEFLAEVRDPWTDIWKRDIIS